MKKLLFALIAAVVLLGAATGIVAWQLDRFLSTPVNVPPDGALFEISPGSSFTSVARDLASQDIIDNDFWYRLYARLSGKAVNVQAGEYLIAAGTTPRGLLQQFTSGAVRLYSFTIIEGWNHRDLLAALQSDEAVEATLTGYRPSTAVVQVPRACSCPRPTVSRKARPTGNCSRGPTPTCKAFSTRSGRHAAARPRSARPTKP